MQTYPSKPGRYFRLSVLAVSACQWLVFGCSTPVAVGLTDEDAKRAVSALAERGISSDVVRRTAERGHVVEVYRADAERALRTLEELPRATSPTLSEALGPEPVVPSRSSERARLGLGLAGELERTLMKLEGVAHARVHVVLGDAAPLAQGRPHETAKASALLTVAAQSAPSEAVVRSLMVGAVPGLAGERIEIVIEELPRVEVPTVELARVGPITTTRTALGRARTVVATAVVSNLFMCGLCVVLWRRSSRRRTRETGAGRP